MIPQFEDEPDNPFSLYRNNRPVPNPVRPLVTGQQAPFFSVSGAPAAWWEPVPADRTGPPPTAPGQTTSVLDLIREKPLVVSFYCPCWGAYARPFLNGLVHLYDHLRAAGAELLVFSSEPVRVLQRQLGTPGFLIEYDADFAVAQRFGVYSEANPIWERVSGISDDVVTPALYLVGPQRRIVYHFLDENFDTPLNGQALITAVNELNRNEYDPSR